MSLLNRRFQRWRRWANNASDELSKIPLFNLQNRSYSNNLVIDDLTTQILEKEETIAEYTE